MRMLMHVQLPPNPFNQAVRDGTAGDKLKKILDDTKPEAVYFTEQNGCRGATMVINVENESQIPFYAEPWFLLFDASIQFRILMTPEDLSKSGLDDLAKKWG